MKKIVLVSTLVASVLATAVSAQANGYIDPRAPFNAAKFFASIPSGQ